MSKELEKLREWEKEFDDKFGDFGHIHDNFKGVPMPEEIKSFIQKLFQERDKLLVDEILKIKTDYKNEPNTFIDGMEAMRSDVLKVINNIEPK